MKKLMSIVLALLVIFTLVGCNKNQEILTVMSPAGAPALSQLLIQENSDRYLVDVVNGPDPLVAAFGSGSHDFIFAATNMGAKLYTSNQEYIFLAAVSFGSMFLVTMTDEVFSLAFLEGKDIIVFGQNQTPDIIIQYLLNTLSIECTFTYVDSVATATALFIADHSKIILTAEPSFSALISQVADVDFIDLQDEYESITGKDSYPQAGVFGKASLTKAQINQFLADLEASVTTVNTDIEKAIELAILFEYGFSRTILLTAIPNSHLGFVSAQNCKAEVEEYFNLILAFNPVLLGNQLPESSFYYQP